MIKLIDKGPDESVIEFRPRSSKGPLKDVTKKLIYGQECKWCGNTIQALFLTDTPINLEPYEQTKVISQGDKNEGLLLKMVPNDNDKDSAYKINFYKTKHGNAQLIRLKNHIINWDGLNGNSEYYFEVGERCCKYTGVVAIREDTIVKELALICRYPFVLGGYQKPKTPVPLSFLEEWKPIDKWSQLDFVIPNTIGIGPKVVLINRNLVKGDMQVTGPFQDMFKQWNAKVDAAGIVVPNAEDDEDEDEDEPPF